MRILRGTAILQDSLAKTSRRKLKVKLSVARSHLCLLAFLSMMKRLLVIILPHKTTAWTLTAVFWFLPPLWKHHVSEAATLRPQWVGWLRASRPVDLQDVRVPLYSRASGHRQEQAKNQSVSLLWRYTCLEIPSCLLFIRANSPIRRWSKTALLHQISSVVDNAPLRPIITLVLPGIQLRPQPMNSHHISVAATEEWSCSYRWWMMMNLLILFFDLI